MSKKHILLLINVFTLLTLHSQSAPFQIALEPLEISGVGGLQSFAYGQYDGKWLIIGGRLDGLHRRQPFATFDIAGHNTRLMVIDPLSKKHWSAPITSLPMPLQEQLKSTNMQFYQQGKYLYLLGGYGYSAIEGDHTTFSNLTSVDVSETLKAIIENKSLIQYFKQITDKQFQVTGGSLDKINNTFYLVGGHKFLGRYNPMGPDHGPGFVQEYTNQIRKFNIKDNGESLFIEHLPSIIDTNHFHRRDYNAVAQIFPNKGEGLTAFSGVFQKTINLPYLNCVNIDSSGYSVNNDFTQYYNHYHCANFPIYSEKSNEMNTVFFGGIAQYYDSLGILTQNNDVPFVKTIARVSRDKNGKMTEFKLPIEMPTLLGAGSEFIINEDLPRYDNGVIKFDQLQYDTTMIGYIYGGISSTQANIFWINNGTQSSASSQIFKVLLIKNNTSSADDLNEQSTSNLKLEVFPNPNKGLINVRFNLNEISPVKITILSSEGKTIIKEKLKSTLVVGENNYSKYLENVKAGGTYFLTIETKFEKVTRKIIIEL